MKKKECEICFEIRELVTIHDNHSCCKECLNNIVDNPNYSKVDGAVCRCPFCRRNICETNDKTLNRKLKHLYIEEWIYNKFYRRNHPKNAYRYIKRIKKDELKSIQSNKYFNKRKRFKKNNNYKIHYYKS